MRDCAGESCIMKEFAIIMKNAQEGESKAKEQLIMENMGLVYTVARRFINRGLEMDDLIQIGTVGLIKAIDRFDLSYEVCFSTYAIPMIMGEIRRYLRDNGSMRVSRSLKERAIKVMQEKEKIFLDTGKEPSIREIANFMGLKDEDVVECLDACVSPVSLSEAITGEGNDALYVEDQIRDKKENEEKWVEKLAIEEAMDFLTEREKKVIVLKYYMGKTQGEIATYVNLSQAQVSRIEKSALLSLRGHLSD